MNWDVRQYQQEAVAACLGAFAERKCTSVMLESPVGSGKTYMALEVIHALQERLGRRLRLGLLLAFASVFNGAHVKHKKLVTEIMGSDVTVEFDRPTALQIDGETVTDVLKYEVHKEKKIIC